MGRRPGWDASVKLDWLSRLVIDRVFSHLISTSDSFRLYVDT
jgi:hypothetical protein